MERRSAIRCNSYWKGSLLIALDYDCQLYLFIARNVQTDKSGRESKADEPESVGVNDLVFCATSFPFILCSGRNHPGYIIFWTPTQIILQVDRPLSSMRPTQCIWSHSLLTGNSCIFCGISAGGKGCQRLVYFRKMVDFLLFLSLVSDFPLACHPRNLCSFSLGNAQRLFFFILGIRCISSFFPLCPNSAVLKLFPLKRSEVTFIRFFLLVSNFSRRSIEIKTTVKT